MNQGQEKFYSFIMSKIDKSNEQAAKALLNESFEKQNNGTFNAEYMSEFMPKMLELIKPEFKEEVKNIMFNHKKTTPGI